MRLVGEEIRPSRPIRPPILRALPEVESALVVEGEAGRLLLQDLRLQDNLIPGTIPPSIGNLVRLRYLDLYNNRMVGDVPPGIQNLTNLKELYLQNEHLTPVRQRYCRQRIPNVGKYSWRMVRRRRGMGDAPRPAPTPPPPSATRTATLLTPRAAALAPWQIISTSCPSGSSCRS